VFKIYAYCGGVICDSGIYQFMVTAPNCCTGGSWNSLTFNGLPITTTAGTLGNIATSAPINMIASYNCGPACAGSAIIHYVVQQGSYSMTYTSSPLAPPTAGSSILTVYVICGGDTCQNFSYQFMTVSCCTGSNWGIMKYKRAGFGGITALPCGTTLLPMHHSSITKFKVCFNCSCGSAKIEYTVTGPGGYSWTSGLVPNCTGINAVMPPTTGTALLTIKAYCGGVVCKVCTDKLIIIL
jgi:hypothetical protein